MTRHDDHDDDADHELEQLLRRYRPVGPPDALRERVERVTAGATVLARPSWFGLAVAAMVLVAFALNLAAQRTTARTAAEIGSGPVLWTPAAESAARSLGGDDQARRYVAARLTGRSTQ